MLYWNEQSVKSLLKFQRISECARLELRQARDYFGVRLSLNKPHETGLLLYFRLLREIKLCLDIVCDILCQCLRVRILQTGQIVHAPVGYLFQVTKLRSVPGQEVLPRFQKLLTILCRKSLLKQTLDNYTLPHKYALWRHCRVCDKLLVAQPDVCQCERKYVTVLAPDLRA